MRLGVLATIALLTLCWTAAAPLRAADLRVRPATIVAGEPGTIQLTVDPNRLWPKPRAEILYAWWCWDIDPRPPECEQHYCNSPLPDDPICNLSKKERAGKLVLKFDGRGVVAKARGACGRTGFVLKARTEGGGISEAKGTTEIDCGGK